LIGWHLCEKYKSKKNSKALVPPSTKLVHPNEAKENRLYVCGIVLHAKLSQDSWELGWFPSIIVDKIQIAYDRDCNFLMAAIVNLAGSSNVHDQCLFGGYSLPIPFPRFRPP